MTSVLLGRDPERAYLELLVDGVRHGRAAAALGAAARGIARECLLLLFATRRIDEHLRELASLPVSGLDPASARTLLQSLVASPLDERVLDRMIAETGGNPLALLDVSRE